MSHHAARPRFNLEHRYTRTRHAAHSMLLMRAVARASSVRDDLVGWQPANQESQHRADQSAWTNDDSLINPRGPYLLIGAARCLAP